MRIVAALSVTFLATPAFGCLVFCFSNGEHVLAGNNEDYFVPDTRMWFVPGESGQHGRVYFGYSNGFPQGGLNDAGLFFDGLALERQTVAASPDEIVHPGNLADLAMAECATVAEVIDLFELHDRSLLASGQLLFADRTGDGAIIEGNAVIRKQGAYLLATNFRQSTTPPASASCNRYRIASRMLGEAKEASVDVCRRVLSATHQESPAATLYSNVCDLRKGLVYLYHFHDYDNVVVIDLAAELAKGARVVELASLFPRTHAYAEFERQAEEADAEQREKERDPNADPRTFGAYVGRYRAEDGEAAGLEFEVTLDGDELFAEFTGQGRFELVPRGGASFVCIVASERADFEFVRGDDGTVNGVTLRQDGVEFHVAKVE